jgi:hypothetical protein
MSRKIKPRLLTRGEYEATFGMKMHDVTPRPGRRTRHLLDAGPYVSEIAGEVLSSYALVDPPRIASVYRNRIGHYDHVLLECARPGQFLVIVTRYLEGEFYGHHLLGLAGAGR